MKKRTVLLAFIMIGISFVVLLFTFGVIGIYSYSPVWTETINGDQNLNDSAVAIAVHSDSRSIYVAGFKNKGDGQSGQPWVAKFMDGRNRPILVWEQDFSGIVSVDIIRIEDIVVDSANTYLYIIGTYIMLGGQSNVFIAQLSTQDGFIEWYATPDIYGFDDSGTGIVLGQDGALYITGHASKGEQVGGIYPDRDIFVAKFIPPNIGPEWIQYYDDPPGPGVNANKTKGGKIILHPNGSIYITACVRDYRVRGGRSAARQIFLITKVNPGDGSFITRVEEDIDAYNTDITADNDGNLCIIFVSRTVQSLIYDVNLARLPPPLFAGNLGDESARCGIVCLPGGGIACVSSALPIVGGQFADHLDIFVVTHPLGWADSVGGDGMRDDYGNDIAVNSSGDIYVVGSVYSQFVNRKSDIWIRKYNRRSAVQSIVFSARRASSGKK